MGDRCYLTFTLTGHIPSMEALDDISEAIADEGLLPEGGVDWEAETIRTAIAEALLDPKHKGGVDFTDEECNYADVGSAESVCQEHGVAYKIDHGSGGDYPAGHAAFLPDEGRFEENSDGSDTAVPLSELQAMLNGHAPLKALRSRIALAARAAGEGQPERISASEDVIAALEAERDAEASKPTPEERFPYSDWQQEVASGDTQRGYADWVAAKLEEQG